MASASAIDRFDPPAQAGVPWTQRWADEMGAGPLGMGALVTAVMCSGLGVLLWVGDRAPVPDAEAAEYWAGMAQSNVLMNVMSGYAVAAMGFGIRAQRRALAQLRPVLELDAAGFDAACRDALAFRRTPLRLAGVTALAVLGYLILFAPEDWGPWPRPGFDQPTLWWVLLTNLVLGWLSARMVMHELGSLRALSRIGAEHAHVDPWDSRPLAPFVRRGLESVLIVIIGTSLLSLQVVGGWASALVPGLLVFMVLLAAGAFLLPVYGVHRRMRQVKWERLDELHAEVRRSEAALSGSDPEAREGAAIALPAQLALRSSLLAASEWPIDLPAIARFVLYVALGLGSWLGAAVVERGLGALLGS